MAYGYRSRGYSRRSSAGYGRRRTTGFGRRAGGARKRASTRRVSRSRAAPQTVRLVIEQAPASGISRMNERVMQKMNPPPGKAKL